MENRNGATKIIYTYAIHMFQNQRNTESTEKSNMDDTKLKKIFLSAYIFKYILNKNFSRLFRTQLRYHVHFKV